MLAQYPKVSILIPTLNSQAVLEECLKSIRMQEWPKASLEILIADGGSTDDTLLIARKYEATVISNALKTAEAGKMCALKASSGDFVALIDSDNILPSPDWLTTMLTPLLAQPLAIGSEPWQYTWRSTDGFITRYCALMGMNDPLVFFLGNYDRVCQLTGVWTNLHLTSEDFGDYLLVDLPKLDLPTIGANGTVFRAEVLKQHSIGDYLFDIDILHTLIRTQGAQKFIKVKTGIIHTYCENDIFKFVRKQYRRVIDFTYFSSLNSRDVNWFALTKFFGYLTFILSCLLGFPLIFQAIYGYLKKPDIAWVFHPVACELTLLAYGWGTVVSVFNKKILDRTTWKQ